MNKFRRLRRTFAKLIQTCDDAIHDFDLPDPVRMWLLLNRMPAGDKNLLEVCGVEPQLFATWEGKRVRVTMASRFGDLGITTDLDSETYQHRVLLFELSDFNVSRVVSLTPDETHLVSEAFDSHIYWQLSEENYRNSGNVIPPGADDPEVVEAIEKAERLQARFE
jgi:hypothetical protein